MNSNSQIQKIENSKPTTTSVLVDTCCKQAAHDNAIGPPSVFVLGFIMTTT